MINNLGRDFAAVLTDVSRMEYDIEDPMRHSKRRIKNDALCLLCNAVDEARRLVELADLIDKDHKNVGA